MQISSTAAASRLMENTRHVRHATVHHRIHKSGLYPQSATSSSQHYTAISSTSIHPSVLSVPDSPFVQGLLPTKYYGQI